MSDYSDNCIFCKIAKNEIELTVEYEDKSIIAFNDKNPQAPVHVLIIPKKHIVGIGDVGPENMHLLGQMAAAAKEIAKKRGVFDSGYRLIINCGKDSGQLIEHLHIHLLGGRQLGWPPG